MKLKLSLYEIFWIKSAYKDLRKEFDELEPIDYINPETTDEDLCFGLPKIGYHRENLRKYGLELLSIKPSFIDQLSPSNIDGIYTFIDLYENV